MEEEEEEEATSVAPPPSFTSVEKIGLFFFLSFVGETAWNAGRVGRELSSDSDADADQDEDEDADDDDNDDDFQPFSSSVFGSACLFPFS